MAPANDWQAQSGKLPRVAWLRTQHTALASGRQTAAELRSFPKGRKAWDGYFLCSTQEPKHGPRWRRVGRWALFLVLRMAEIRVQVSAVTHLLCVCLLTLNLMGTYRQLVLE